MPTTGSSILASDFNSIRTTVETILVTSYGQTLRSLAQQAGIDNIAQDQLEELFLDLQRAYYHQTGGLSSGIEAVIVGQTVGADLSQAYNQSTGAKTNPTGYLQRGFNDLIAVNTDISNFDGSVSGWPDANFTLGTQLSSARSASWGGSGDAVQSIYHVVTFTFSSSDELDYYFNAGGELRFSAALTSPSGSKAIDWQTLLSGMGTIKFDKYRITADSGTPNGSGSGYDSLTGAYRELFVKVGSGNYAENEYTIEGYKPSSTVLRFRIRFNDADTGELPGPVDESVSGTTTSYVNTFRPDSNFVYGSTISAVDVAAPTMATAVAMTTDNGSPPA